uniref:NAD-dependent epimerase/dehydratase domain-containing protein n=1 Tax=viral metagenome TaxID=1070528 RepID=A0A6C0DSV2_9ZZZZ
MKILITGGNGNIAKMIKNYFSNLHDITSPSRNELNILNFQELETFLENNTYDILIHTAISGGRRTKEENGDVTHNNLLMLENVLHFADKFKMIINFDSGAIYDRATDILNRKEEHLFTIPKDYYGFSKYVIYKRSLAYDNFYNLRIFNIFHINEEPDRFIKTCFIAKQNKTPIKIFEDKYFDFVYEDDFIQIMKHYIDNCNSQDKLEKTLNISYTEKYKLSDIAKLITENLVPIEILNDELKKNYSGDNSKLQNLNLSLLGLSKSLKLYEKSFTSK